MEVERKLDSGIIEREWSPDLLKKAFGDFFISPEREEELINQSSDGSIKNAMQFSKEIGEATGAPLTMNFVEVFRDGPKALERIICDIREAVSNINIYTYSWANDTAGQRIANTVCEAKNYNPGLDASVATDKMGCFVVGCKDAFWDYTWKPETLKRAYRGISAKKYPSLNLPGMMLTWIDAEKVYRMKLRKRQSMESIISDNLTPELLRTMNPLFDCMENVGTNLDIRDNGLNTDHSKVTSRDGKVVYLGGRNNGDDYFGRDSWPDHTFRVEGPIATLCEDEWFKMGLDRNIDFGSLEDLSPVMLLINQRSTKLDPVEDMIEGYPDPKEKQITYAIYRALENAKHSIYVEHSYLSDKGIIKRLQDAAQRGVNIKVVRPEPEDINIGVANYNMYEQIGDLPEVEMLDIPFISHAKILNVDGMHTIVGSANFIKSSLHVHGEVGMMFSGDSPIQREMNELYQNTIEVARRTTGIRHKIVGGVLRPMLYGAIHRAIKEVKKSGIIT